MKAKLLREIESDPNSDLTDPKNVHGNANLLEVGEIYNMSPFIEWFDHPCITTEIIIGTPPDYVRVELAYSGKHDDGYNHLRDFFSDWQVLAVEGIEKEEK